MLLAKQQDTDAQLLCQSRAMERMQSELDALRALLTREGVSSAVPAPTLPSPTTFGPTTLRSDAESFCFESLGTELDIDAAMAAEELQLDRSARPQEIPVRPDKPAPSELDIDAAMAARDLQLARSASPQKICFARPVQPPSADRRMSRQDSCPFGGTKYTVVSLRPRSSQGPAAAPSFRTDLQAAIEAATVIPKRPEPEPQASLDLESLWDLDATRCSDEAVVGRQDRVSIERHGRPPLDLGVVSRIFHWIGSMRVFSV